MRAFIASMICLIDAQSAVAAEFTPWQDFPNTSFKDTKLRRDANSGAYCYATKHSRIDADGAPNAYHPADLQRKKPPYLGLDNPANAGWGLNSHASWWPDVLVADPEYPSRPYVQRSGPFAGYFVSQTALRVKGRAQTDPMTYTDSTTVPYLVLPGSTFPKLKGTGAPGDVGMVWNLANGKSAPFVIGDAGGGADAKLGEGSIALFAALGGVNLNPRNGAGVAPGVMRYVVFPGSRKTLGWPATPKAIADLAGQLLEGVGGEKALTKCGT